MYTAGIWHSGLTRKQSNDIESIQKRACKIILSHNFNSYNDELNYCNLDTLADRRLNTLFATVGVSEIATQLLKCLLKPLVSKTVQFRFFIDILNK